MDIAEMVVHDWKFQLVNDQLSITSEQDPNQHVVLNSKAAFSLLDYLYQNRDDLAEKIREQEAAEHDPSRIQNVATFGSGADESTDSGLPTHGL